MLSSPGTHGCHKFICDLLMGHHAACELFVGVLQFLLLHLLFAHVFHAADPFSLGGRAGQGFQKVAGWEIDFLIRMGIHN